MVDENSNELNLSDNPNEEVTEGQDTSQQGVDTAPPAEDKSKEPAPVGEQAVAPKTDQGEVSSPGVDKRITQLTRTVRERDEATRQLKAAHAAELDTLRRQPQQFQPSPQQGQSQTFETQQQMSQLFQLMKQHPEFAAFSGSDKIEALEKENQDFRHRSLEGELRSSALGLYNDIEKKGLGTTREAKDDVSFQVEEFMQSDSHFRQFLDESGSVISPNSERVALEVMLARGMFGDLGQRAASQEIVNNRNNAIKGKSERGTQVKSGQTKIDPNQSIASSVVGMINAGDGEVDMS